MEKASNISNSEIDTNGFGLNGEQSDNHHKSEEKSKNFTSFECNICFENAYEPIVTRCGHLYCWSCICSWLDRGYEDCPVCKAGVNSENVIPLYGRGSDIFDPRKKTKPRPKAERPEARQRNQNMGGQDGHFQNSDFTPGINNISLITVFANPLGALLSLGYTHRYFIREFANSRQPDDNEELRNKLISNFSLFVGILKMSLDEFNELFYETNLDSKVVISAREVVEIGFLASRAIMEIYKNIDAELRINYKDKDNSPVTIADLRANEIICSRLSSNWPQIPIISEESDVDTWENREKYKLCWLVDPLDGTKEFLRRNGEFTVNIGLCENGKPTLGVVSIPSTGVSFFSFNNLGGAYKISTFNSSNIICDRTLLTFIPKSNKPFANNGVIRILKSHNYKCPILDLFAEKFFQNNIKIPFGSSIKFIELVENRADIYPRFHDCMEWDTCASHIIIQQTCGDIYELETFSGSETRFKLGEPLTYNKKILINPYFVAADEKVIEVLKNGIASKSD
ncbi:inositol monophosphatase family [Cryptosporidium sp. chipmunk genotype I]|uniref:inositol monophosphatase family n=1 Tax=Cryptosporidium sp. chipmunk genotype I TaxID=1280935 RepID=UPI00351A7491|nr:inositol monophosphatase family [Cryptosporidium sp. chipmunk genotype I]